MPRSLPRLARDLVLTVALASGLATTPGCAGKLQQIETPAGGVRLEYDLSPGARFSGHVRRSETVSAGPGGQGMNRSLEYDIDLVVLGEDPNRGDILVRATFTNVDIQWTLPPSSGFNMSLDSFVAGAVAAVQGMEVRFNVLPDGKVSYLPPPPEDAEQQLNLVVEAVLDSLETAFFVVPKKFLKDGDTWDDKEKRGREGKLGRYRQGTTVTTFEGMFRDEARAQDVAKLTIKRDGQETITTKSGSHGNEWSGEMTALFATAGKYLASLKGETRKFDPTGGTTFTKIQVEWRKEAAAQVAAPRAAPSGEAQAITDPCDPDYVGPEECGQAITDPCNADYVGPEECKDAAAGDPAAADAAAPEGDAGAEGDGDETGS